MFYLGVDALYASFCFCFDHYLSISFQVDIDLISTFRASFTLDIAEQDALIFKVALSLYIVDFTSRDIAMCDSREGINTC